MRWFLNRSGQAEGPLEEAALVASIERGEVPPTSQICQEGTQAWQPLLSHPPFAQASAKTTQEAAAGVAPTMAMPSVDPASMPGMLGSLSGAAGAATPAPAPAAPTPNPGLPPQATPAPTPQPMQPQPPMGQAPMGQPPAGQPPMGQPHGTPPPGIGAPMSPQPGVAPGQPSPFPAPGQEKKSKLPLMIGGGCGLLLLVSMCIGGGVLAYTQLGSDQFADRAQNVGEIVTRVAVDGQHDDASQWSCVSGEDLMSSPPATRAAMAPLGGNPEIRLTAVELVGIQGSYFVTALALVFPDGRVRYSGVRSSPVYDMNNSPRGWNTGRERDEDLLSGVDALLEELADEECEIEWVTSNDLEGLPTSLVGEVMEGVQIPQLQEACGVVTSTEGWDRAISGIRVVVQGNDETAVLRSSLGQEPGTSVCMAPIRARVMEEPQDPSTP